MAPPPDPGDYDEYEDDEELCAVAALEVVVTEPELLATLLGPDGEVIAALYDRRPVPFGFRPTR